MRDSPVPSTINVRLQATDIDIVLGSDGAWHGQGAEAITATLSYQHGFPWPQRLVDIQLTNASIEMGDCNTPDMRALITPIGDDALHAARIERHWPLADRQKYVPCIAPFRILAQPGARLVATWLHEILR